MSPVGDAVVGDVQTEPLVAIGVDVNPSVAGKVADVAGIEVAADVARGDADGACCGEENVRLILAHALRLGECLRCGGLYGGYAAYVLDALMYGLHQAQGVVFGQHAVRLCECLCKGVQFGVGRGVARGLGKNQRRYAAVFGRSAVG